MPAARDPRGNPQLTTPLGVAAPDTPDTHRPPDDYPWPRSLAASNVRFRKTLGIYQARMGEIPPAVKGKTTAE